jgi:hypothetical protein
MKKVIKPEIIRDKLGKNPLLTNLKVVISKMEIPGQWKMVDGRQVPVDMEMERTSFTKMFSDSERRKDMIKLGNRAKDLLMWIMYEVDPNCDYLWLNKWRYMSESGISTYNTYNNALNELIEAGYIARCARPANTFFINPHYFFNGNRIKCFPDHVVKR